MSCPLHETETFNMHVIECDKIKCSEHLLESIGADVNQVRAQRLRWDSEPQRRVFEQRPTLRFPNEAHCQFQERRGRWGISSKSLSPIKRRRA